MAEKRKSYRWKTESEKQALDFINGKIAKHGMILWSGDSSCGATARSRKQLRVLSRCPFINGNEKII